MRPFLPGIHGDVAILDKVHLECCFFDVDTFKHYGILGTKIEIESYELSILPAFTRILVLYEVSRCLAKRTWIKKGRGRLLRLSLLKRKLLHM